MAWSDDERADGLHTTVPCEWFEELLLDLRQPPVVNPVLERAAHPTRSDRRPGDEVLAIGVVLNAQRATPGDSPSGEHSRVHFPALLG